MFTRFVDELYFCVWIVAVDSVLKRMTIIGVILSFRSLAQEALRDVRQVTIKRHWSHSEHDPFKMSIYYNDLFNTLLSFYMTNKPHKTIMLQRAQQSGNCSDVYYLEPREFYWYSAKEKSLDCQMTS